MGFRPIVHCRQCGEALDVFLERSERFCSEECQEEYRYHHPGVVEIEDAAESRVDI